jgi:hypothetical protein
MKEISLFIKETNNIPREGINKVQNNLYRSFIKTRNAYINKELSENQLKLLNEYNLVFG